MTDDLVGRQTDAEVAAKLTKAQRAFIASLPTDRAEKHWPQGMSQEELGGLRGFGQSGLVVGRYVHSGVYIALTPLGLRVAQHLKENAK